MEQNKNTAFTEAEFDESLNNYECEFVDLADDDFSVEIHKNEKPQIGKAILCVMPSLIVFFVSQFLLVIVLALLFGLLLNIPLINKLLGLLVNSLGHTGDSLVIWISVLLSYLLTGWVQGLMMKNHLTECISRKITGSIIIGFNILCLILNIIFHNPLLVNLTCIFFGFFYTFYSEKN